MNVFFILFTVIVLSAASVYAGPPLDGTWSSTNGDFDEGTAASVGDHNQGYPVPNAVVHGRSYAGGVFTNDWEILCAPVGTVVPLNGALGSTGNGNYTFMIHHDGGYLSLGGPGNPWNGGDAVYTAAIDIAYIETRTVQWVNGAVVGAVSDHAISATIQGYSDTCVSWAIGNGVLRGGNVLEFNPAVLPTVKPANYPDYINSFCEPSGPYGTWEDIKDLTLSIHGCTLKTESSSWGRVKAMYRK